jgi:RNA polymerase sigma-32 factor
MNKVLDRAKHYEYLSEDEERALAERWCSSADKKAGDMLVTSHMRLVIKIAYKYRHYDVALDDLVSEGNRGLLEALKRYELKKEVRFSTYARWWIKAAILEYVIRNASIVKIGTTSQQKRLFFGLRAAKEKFQIFSGHNLTEADAKVLAEHFEMPVEVIYEMNSRLVSNLSLQDPIGIEAAGAGKTIKTWQDTLLDEAPNPHELLERKNEQAYRKKLLHDALQTLPERHQEIVFRRNLKDEPDTLDALSAEYGISSERIRQIEVEGLRKIYKLVRKANREALTNADRLGS